MPTSEIAKSQEYQSFRASVSQHKVQVDDGSNKEWTLYDAGPRCVRCPLVCFPPASGTADIFFKQILGLTARGYRVISMEYPVLWSLEDFCESFRKLLDHLKLDRIHIFGASLGGFLAQKFAEYTYKSPRVQSIILCNSFVDTDCFQQSQSSTTYWVLPGFLLKKMVMGNFASARLLDYEIANSVDFMVERLDSLGQSELASRLTINCASSYVEPQKLKDMHVTLIDVFDNSAISQSVKDEMYKCYPDAKRAHLKSGGNFPYLSRSDEVNLHIQIHLRVFLDTRYNACDPNVSEENGTDNGASTSDSSEHPTLFASK
ncbi:maspardin-like [Anneissia japonica]|uniref:maspardin-like n=1 Tax=Anneissia japonica TaxID=1529436 RepID=UPI001425981E|nr:maspardin-like [Anneissia japonica]